MRRIFLILSLVLCFGRIGAQTLSEEAEIYLLTCTAGEEVWSKYGHTGIRVVDRAQDMDVVFNYGLFSMQEKGFYLKFVRGETCYQLGIEPYRYFREFYGAIGRKTYWQSAYQGVFASSNDATSCAATSGVPSASRASAMYHINSSGRNSRSSLLIGSSASFPNIMLIPKSTQLCLPV